MPRISRPERSKAAKDEVTVSEDPSPLKPLKSIIWISWVDAVQGGQPDLTLPASQPAQTNSGAWNPPFSEKLGM